MYSMGIPDHSILDLIHKVGSWIYWGSGDLDSCSSEYKMAKICCDCMMPVVESSSSNHCQRCGRILCENCVQSNGCIGVVSSGNSILDGSSEAGAVTNYCKFCSHISNKEKVGKKFIEKVYPSDSPRQSPEPPSPCSTGRCDECCHPDSARSIIHYSPSR